MEQQRRRTDLLAPGQLHEEVVLLPLGPAPSDTHTRHHRQPQIDFAPDTTTMGRSRAACSPDGVLIVLDEHPLLQVLESPLDQG